MKNQIVGFEQRATGEYLSQESANGSASETPGKRSAEQTADFMAQLRAGVAATDEAQRARFASALLPDKPRKSSTKPATKTPEWLAQNKVKKLTGQEQRSLMAQRELDKKPRKPKRKSAK